MNPRSRLHPSLRLIGAVWLLVVSTPPLRAQPLPPVVASWDARAAAAYLDRRASWWLDWPNASRDHGTACVSCHTTLPYALARPVLRQVLDERDPAAPEARVLAGVETRVMRWNEVEPFYPDQRFGLPKSSESRGTEAVLNALILTDADARGGRVTERSRRALDNLWALQFTRGDGEGAWAWLRFDLAPWESEGAAYFGAALAAVASGTAATVDPRSGQDREDRFDLLRGYLLEGWQGRPAYDRVMLLWASTRLPGLLTPEQTRVVVQDLSLLQNDDGGWNLASLRSWPREDGGEQDRGSDGYATGLVAWVLQRAGASPVDAPVSRALTWLAEHQDPVNGAWRTASLNRYRDPDSDRGLLMSDAATAFAVLALVEAEGAGNEP